MELEAHAAKCFECAETLRDAVALDAIVDRAFAPLREARTSLAPGRVRLALAPRRRESPARWLPATRLFTRVAEVSVALGVTLFVLTSTLESPPAATPQTPSVIQAYYRSRPPADALSMRWARLQPGGSQAQADAVRFPAGGRYDYDLHVDIDSYASLIPR
jgi:hypothetical protein